MRKRFTHSSVFKARQPKFYRVIFKCEGRTPPWKWKWNCNFLRIYSRERLVMRRRGTLFSPVRPLLLRSAQKVKTPVFNTWDVDNWCKWKEKQANLPPCVRKTYSQKGIIQLEVEVWLWRKGYYSTRYNYNNSFALSGSAPNKSNMHVTIEALLQALKVDVPRQWLVLEF